MCVNPVAQLRHRGRSLPVSARCFFGSIFLVAMVTANPATADNIEITQAVWSANVNLNTRDAGKALSGTAPLAPIYLWNMLRGSAEAIAQIKTAGKLPIRHKWFRTSYSGVTAQGVETPVIDDIALHAGYKSLLEQLEGEVNRQGYFEWRTWSRKINVSRGLWTVRIVYADNEPVMCGEMVTRKPCEFQITLQ